MELEIKILKDKGGRNDKVSQERRNLTLLPEFTNSGQKEKYFVYERVICHWWRIRG